MAVNLSNWYIAPCYQDPFKLKLFGKRKNDTHEGTGSSTSYPSMIWVSAPILERTGPTTFKAGRTVCQVLPSERDLDAFRKVGWSDEVVAKFGEGIPLRWTKVLQEWRGLNRLELQKEKPSHTVFKNQNQHQEGKSNTTSRNSSQSKGLASKSRSRSNTSTERVISSSKNFQITHKPYEPSSEVQLTQQDQENLKQKSIENNVPTSAKENQLIDSSDICDKKARGSRTSVSTRDKREKAGFLSERGTTKQLKKYLVDSDSSEEESLEEEISNKKSRSKKNAKKIIKKRTNKKAIDAKSSLPPIKKVHIDVGEKENYAPNAMAQGKPKSQKQDGLKLAKEKSVKSIDSRKRKAPLGPKELAEKMKDSRYRKTAKFKNDMREFMNSVNENHMDDAFDSTPYRTHVFNTQSLPVPPDVETDIWIHSTQATPATNIKKAMKGMTWKTPEMLATTMAGKEADLYIAKLMRNEKPKKTAPSSAVKKTPVPAKSNKKIDKNQYFDKKVLAIDDLSTKEAEGSDEEFSEDDLFDVYY